MNKKVSAFIAIALAAGTMVGCSSKSSTSASGAEGKVINIYSWNDEFRQRVEAVYPEVKSTSKDGTVTKLKDGSEIHWIINPNQDGVYQQKLDEALEKQDSASADDKIDIFLSETDYVRKYTSKKANVAMPLKDLGIDPKKDLADQYAFTKETASETQEIVEEIESLDYDITDETAMLEENQKAQEQEGETETEAETETPGEAVLTGSSNFAAQAKVNREQVRSANKETLLEIINNENLGEEQKQDAVNSMVNMTNLAEQEEAAELLLEAQGFSNIVVNLTGDSADVIVPKEYMEDARRAQIEDIVKRKTSVPAENIVITPLEGESEEKTSP